MTCERHRHCKGYVYIAAHPQAGTANGFHTKIGFSKHDPKEVTENRKLKQSYPSRNSRVFGMTFFSDAFGLKRPRVAMTNEIEHARCLEAELKKQYRESKQPNCGIATEIFNVPFDVLKAELGNRAMVHEI